MILHFCENYKLTPQQLSASAASRDIAPKMQLVFSIIWPAFLFYIISITSQLTNTTHSSTQQTLSKLSSKRKERVYMAKKWFLKHTLL